MKGKKPNILIVDDSKVICKTLEKLIKEELSYEPIIAHSKVECEKILLEYKNSIDVALLDLELPDAKTGQVVDLVSKFNIPSIVLTSSIEKEDLFRSKKIVDYVIKESSFSFRYAVSLVQRIINNNDKEVLIVSNKLQEQKNTVELLKRYQLKPLLYADMIEALHEIKKNRKIKMVYIEPSNLDNYGIELLKQIRKIYTKNELVITMIADSNIIEEQRKLLTKFLKYGANDFIYESYSEEEFYARLTSNLDSIDQFEEMHKKANVDFLTGVYNRRYFFKEGVRRFNDEENVKLCIIDIDKFKNINDTYGHDIGDLVIKYLAKSVVTRLENHDTIMARFGGEEFCVLFFNESDESFLNTLEAMRKGFENASLKTKEGEVKFTVSIGYSLEKMPTIDHMLHNADKGLYKAKNSGRNQVRSIHEN
jgi:diguanylate cyclase (GGDEF)-like protein